jgi:hypothetical protein
MNDLSTRQNEEFQARLARIAGASQVEAEQVALASAGGTARTLPRDTKRFRIPRGAIIAGLLAIGAFLLASSMVFAQKAMPPGPGDFFGKVILAGGPLALTAAFLFVLMIGLGLRDKPHVIGIVIALPAIYFGEPYLAHAMPEFWAQLYSPEHVDNMLIQAGLRTPPPAF